MINNNIDIVILLIVVQLASYNDTGWYRLFPHPTLAVTRPITL